MSSAFCIVNKSLTYTNEVWPGNRTTSLLITTCWKTMNLLIMLNGIVTQQCETLPVYYAYSSSGFMQDILIWS